MQEFTISLMVNIILGILVLKLVFPNLKEGYLKMIKEREVQRDTERKEEIRQVVIEFLKELQDGGTTKGS